MPTTPRLPTGTVTFLFTDIEGSTRLWEAHPETMRDALATHDAIFREIVPHNSGVIFKTVGDAICAAFERPDDALLAAVEAQRRLTAHEWPQDIGSIRVRMGIHTGMAQERDDDYFGPAVNRVARFMSIAHGGQILVSGSTQALLRHANVDVSLRELGEQFLKDLNEPEPAFQVVAEGLATTFPSLTSLKAHRNNLPAQISSFVGRVREMRELRHAANRHRLISIVGPGGIGKTRIALRLADEAVDHFRDGAWFVELASISDPKLIAQTVAEAFGLREQSQQSVDDQLLEFLAHKKLLLVFDNSEHMIAETAELSKLLLGRCAGLAIVITSRERLHLTGEHVYHLAPLSVVAKGTSEAVQLFIERARQNQTDVTAGAEAAIDRICRRLEGIPLAIELAAARTGALTIADVESRLTNRLALLVSRDITQDARQRTLRGAIDWSYQLLAPEERRFARALSVFEGGFTVQAAQHVTASGDALDMLESLNYKSLIAAVPGSPGRHVILEMIGEYFRDALATEGEAEAIGERHYAFFYDCVVGQSGAAAPEARILWAQAVEADIANVRVALEWALEHRLSDVPKFVVALTDYWRSAGQVAEAEAWCRRALDRPDLADRDRALLLRRASSFAIRRSHHEEGYRFIVAAREAYQRLGDQSGIMETTYYVAVIEHRLGLERAAEEHYLEALAGFEAIGHVNGRVRSAMNLVLLAINRHDVQTAQTYLARASDAAIESKDADLHGDLAGLRATVLHAEGAYAEALVIYAAIIKEKRDLGNRYAVADLLLCSAATLIANGDLRAAVDALREVFQIEEADGATAHTITALEGAAEVLVRLLLFERAAVAHSRAARLRARYQYRTTHVWDSDERDQLLRRHARSNSCIVQILDDTTTLEWSDALGASLLDGLTGVAAV